MILNMYIAPGQGLITPLGINLDVSRNILSVWSLVASLKQKQKKNKHDFIHVYSPEAEADSP